MNGNEILAALTRELIVCTVCFFGVLWLLRRNGPSLGLPFAYMILLLLYHMPGAAVPLMDFEFNAHIDEVEMGFQLTAIGAVCFAIGLWVARATSPEQKRDPLPPSRLGEYRNETPFWLFCLGGGWLFTFGLTPLRNLPTVGAVVYNGGALWMLGTLLGLRWSLRNKQRKWTMFWLGCLCVYPVMILFTHGFLSYGTAAVVVVLSALAVAGRSYLRICAITVFSIYMGLSLFSNYFQARNNIRDAVWLNGSLEKRVGAVAEIFTNFKFFDSTDQIVLAGLDIRLNQNLFVGLAAENLQNGSVKYLDGSSISDAMLSLIPRALWPGKTVFGGSPEIVSKMTGLSLSTTTSFGVGNVMEFYINFGLPGVIGGFLLLGWGLGWMDQRAAQLEARGRFDTLPFYFLTGVGMLQPLGSLVELTGACGTAWISGYFWRWAWARWQRYQQEKALAAAATQP